MKRNKQQFWLFGMDAILEFGQEGVLEAIEISKQIKRNVIRKFKNQKMARKTTKKYIQIGKKQDRKLEVAHSKSSTVKKSDSKQRIKAIRATIDTKDKTIEQEP
ncbi:hypothetical protein [Polaribacter sp.]|uniref:hypothetical protein n=1 Tax=Polaribacter sp. TaxID=1920175 RepID=UPI003F6B8804